MANNTPQQKIKVFLIQLFQGLSYKGVKKMLTKDQLKELNKYAELQFSYKECAIILNVDFNKLFQCLKNSKSPEYLNYESGRLLSAATIRKSIFEHAKNGSNPAQKQMLELIQKTENENLVSKESLKKNLVIFANLSIAGEKYSNHDTTGLFVLEKKFINSDNKPCCKIKKIKKIYGTIKTSENTLNVLTNDIRQIYPEI